MFSVRLKAGPYAYGASPGRSVGPRFLARTRAQPFCNSAGVLPLRSFPGGLLSPSNFPLLRGAGLVLVLALVLFLARSLGKVEVIVKSASFVSLSVEDPLQGLVQDILAVLIVSFPGSAGCSLCTRTDKLGEDLLTICGVELALVPLKELPEESQLGSRYLETLVVRDHLGSRQRHPHM